MPDGSWISAQRRALGEERMGRYIEGNGLVQANLMSLNMSVNFAPGTGYTEEALAAVRTDANDFEREAKKYAAFCRRLADEWGAQRVADERRKERG